MDFSRFQTVSKSDSKTVDQGLRDYMLQVYNHMFMGLALTGLVAFFVSSSPAMLQVIFGTPLKWLVMFAPLVVVIGFSMKLKSMKYTSARNLFYLYAGLMGLSLSVIFIAYTGASIARAFFITSSMFGGMSLYGYTTKKDLTSWGSFLYMGVFGIIILSIINIFTHSTGLQTVISLAAIVIFVGLTAYDTQKIKQMYFQLGGTSEMAKKMGIYGALTLYIDFINIFIHLLHLIGERR
jgi:FtsH-binding integral membrane protein